MAAIAAAGISFVSFVLAASYSTAESAIGKYTRLNGPGRPVPTSTS